MSKEKIKVYLYTRVSTTMQIDGYSLDAQKTKMKAFCDYNEYEITGEYKVVLKERDAWSDLANFIGEMVAKYAEAMDLDNLPDPDFYLRRERIRQLYTELYKEKNITQLELSRRTGIATSNISDWKKKKTNPKADCLLSICDALEITPEQLLTGKGIDPEYKDADMDYEVTRSDIKILKQIHSLGDAQYKRLMAYMKALQKLEQMENMVEE